MLRVPLHLKRVAFFQTGSAFMDRISKNISYPLFQCSLIRLFIRFVSLLVFNLIGKFSGGGGSEGFYL